MRRLLAWIWRHRVVRVVALVVLASVGWFVYNLYGVWSTGRANEARPADAIVVLGAAQYDGRPSPLLAARLDHVVELWQQGIAPLVVVTGGNQPGDRFTEASSSARYLIERGIPDGSILREDQSHTTYGSLVTVSRMLHERSLQKVVLVSDPFHMQRCKLIAEDLGLQAFVSATRTSPVRGSSAIWRQLKEAAGVSVGRIIGFDRLTTITG